MPTQFGKHFWPPFSYVQGLRVDYLSPTFYTTDLLISLLFVFWLVKIVPHFKLKKLLQYKKEIVFGVLFLCSVVIGIVFSSSSLSGWYYLLKLLEFLFFGFFTARYIHTKKQFALTAIVFASGIWVESLISFFQYFQQGSLNGLFYFLGERSFTGSTPGIANASLNGALVLRPYATFPHPNVLAAYLVVTMTFVLSRVSYKEEKIQKLFLVSSLVMGTLALFLTMSRVALLIWIAICLFKLPAFLKRFTKKKQYLLYGALIGIISIALFSPLGSRFTSLTLNDESVVFRKQLIDASLEMIKAHPIGGVGLGNFLHNLSLQKNVISQTILILQPVHTIYLLVLAETGVVGFLFFIWFLFKTLRRVMNEKFQIKNKKPMTHNWKLILLVAVIILGFFDHYFLTLQQGQLLFAFVLGLCWSKENNRQ